MAEVNSGIQREPQSNDRWDEYLRWARRFVEWGDWDATERDYKLEIGERLVYARLALLEGDADWYERLRVALSNNNLVSWQSADTIRKWARQQPEAAGSALRLIWDEERSLVDRFNDFAAMATRQGVPIRIAEASTLHIAMDPVRFPVLRAVPVQKSYELVGFTEDKSTTSSLGARYEHYLAFLDGLMERAEAVGIKLRDRLDAQSVIWSMSSKESLPNATAEEQAEFDRYRGEPGKNHDTEQVSPAPEPESGTDDFESAITPGGVEPESEAIEYSLPSFAEISAAIAKTGLRISSRTLRRYHLSLSSRGFVILAGVSGSGKTWLAEAYAEAAGAEHELIAVAPNWTTNEDLLGFYNPVTNRYHHTPFSRFIRRASDDWKAAKGYGSRARPYHIILDEMNLARVEHYFASFLSKMEIRARHDLATIDLGGGDSLELTPNLYVIGTVNIDETTHGFADKVWDRAQLVELDLPRDGMESHLSGQPFADDILAIWDTVRIVGPFAYRVADDIANYVSTAEAMGTTWQEALDEQILQKILPKLKGTKPEVETVLKDLVDILEERYPLSHDRAQQMLEGIRQYGFASYFS